MLTREETAKVFAMYLGQQVKTAWGVKIVGLEFSSTEETIHVCVAGDYVFPLLLTPLSAMTDEHAVEVAKMLYPDNHHMHTVFYGKLAISTPKRITYPVADKLRSWGYMLPYNGVDLFQAWVAIIKQ